MRLVQIRRNIRRPDPPYIGFVTTFRLVKPVEADQSRVNELARSIQLAIRTLFVPLLFLADMCGD